MRTPLHAGIVLSSLALLTLPLAAAAEHGRHRSEHAAPPAKAPVPATPAAGPPVSPLPPGERQLAAIRVECNEGLTPPQCQAVSEAASESAQRAYRVVDPAQVEAVLDREPALRGCRREDCRVAIADQLGADKLIDVAAQVHNHCVVGTVSIYDPVAKGISGDTEIPCTKRDEGHLRRAVSDTVDYVIGAQKLTASLKLHIEPEGARVRIDNGDRGTVREVRLFLGTHTVRIERVGFLPSEQTVNVTPAGAALDVKLQLQPVRVPFEWFPPDARILVDGDPVDVRNSVVELVTGHHQVQALAPAGSRYDSRTLDINVVTGMGPVRIVLPKLAQLSIAAPEGYTVQIDNNFLAPGEVRPGHVQQILASVSPGVHNITAVSWRGRQRSTTQQAVADRRTEVVLTPPSLVPGAVLGSLGLLTLVGGAVALHYDGQCTVLPTPPATVCPNLISTAWQSYTAFGVGGALLLGGVVWFAYNAVDHPAFHHGQAPRKSAARASLPRFTLAPAPGAGGGRLLLEGRF